MVAIALSRRPSRLHRGRSQVHYRAFYRGPTRSLTRKPTRIQGLSGPRASCIRVNSPILPTANLSVEKIERSHSDFDLQVARGTIGYVWVWYPCSYPATQPEFPHCAVTYSVGSWHHYCELDVATVNLLFERQEASLRAFACNRYSSSCDVSGSEVEGLRLLSIESMDLDRGGCEWAASMLFVNAESLRDLHLGFTNRIAHDYALKRRPQHDEMSALLASGLDKILSECSPEDPLIHLSLESLALCGFDFGSVVRSVVRNEIGLDVDFNNLTMLRLESCAGLSQAFQLLMGQADSSKLALSALQGLFVRLEEPVQDLFVGLKEPVQDFTPGLESFLTSIGGLTSLQVLIDGASATQDLEPILKVHGESLRMLVWDERRGRRTHLGVSTSLLPSKVGNLNVISQYCRCLEVLAIPLDWEAIRSSDEHHMAVTESNSHTTYPSADGL